MKLLNRTIQSYLLYSGLLVLVFTPLFYFSIQALFIREMDRILRSHKNDFYASVPYLNSNEERHFFQLVNKEFVLKDAPAVAGPDTIFTEKIADNETGVTTEFRVLRTAVEVGGRSYLLFIRESMLPGTSLIAAIMGVQICLLLLLTAGILLINRKLSKSIWSPFYIILDRLRKYQIDQDTPPLLPALPTAEFRELSSVITQLISKSHEAYLSQKEFTENASHELQTPLAICRTKLELLAQTKELTQEQAELVGSLLDATDRITRLNKNLLLLSKIENRQFIENEKVDLDAIILKVISIYRRQIEGKHLNIRTSLNHGTTIQGNPVLIEVLTSNLISNAIRHTEEAGEIYLHGDSQYLVIQNSGEPMQNPEKLFNRFHRESRSSAGSGLGLSIARKIAEVSGYQLSYNYEGKHHIFKVIF